MGSQGVEKRRKELKVTKREQPHTQKKIFPAVNAQKLQFCKLQKKYTYSPKGEHNLIALSYDFAHQKNIQSRENCVVSKIKRSTFLRLDLLISRLQKISLNPHKAFGEAWKIPWKHPQLLLESKTTG